MLEGSLRKPRLWKTKKKDLRTDVPKCNCPGKLRKPPRFQFRDFNFQNRSPLSLSLFLSDHADISLSGEDLSPKISRALRNRTTFSEVAFSPMRRGGVEGRGCGVAARVSSHGVPPKYFKASHLRAEGRARCPSAGALRFPRVPHEFHEWFHDLLTQVRP